jgi:hypothetical protein
VQVIEQLIADYVRHDVAQPGAVEVQLAGGLRRSTLSMSLDEMREVGGRVRPAFVASTSTDLADSGCCRWRSRSAWSPSRPDRLSELPKVANASGTDAMFTTVVTTDASRHSKTPSVSAPWNNARSVPGIRSRESEGQAIDRHGLAWGITLDGIEVIALGRVRTALLAAASRGAPAFCSSVSVKLVLQSLRTPLRAAVLTAIVIVLGLPHVASIFRSAQIIHDTFAQRPDCDEPAPSEMEIARYYRCVERLAWTQPSPLVRAYRLLPHPFVRMRALIYSALLALACASLYRAARETGASFPVKRKSEWPSGELMG